MARFREFLLHVIQVAADSLGAPNGNFKACLTGLVPLVLGQAFRHDIGAMELRSTNDFTGPCAGICGEGRQPDVRPVAVDPVFEIGLEIGRFTGLRSVDVPVDVIHERSEQHRKVMHHLGTVVGRSHDQRRIVFRTGTNGGDGPEPASVGPGLFMVHVPREVFLNAVRADPNCRAT